MKNEIDYAKALLDPESVFVAPEDVLTCEGLTKEQKIEVLRRWEYEASEVEVAEEEGISLNNEEKSEYGKRLLTQT